MMKSKPNVLLLLSDQHHAGVLGCTGHPDAYSPNLDALAADGIRFDRAYCQDAVCAPSRGSIFSGSYPRTLGCFTNNDRSNAMEQAIPIQEHLQSAGYRTANFGKRHLYQGIDNGWDEKASHLKIESLDDNYVDWLDEQGLLETFALDWAAEFGCGPETSRLFETEYPRAPLTVRDTQLADDKTMEAWTAQRSISFIEDALQSDQAFFCSANFYRPHQPYTPVPKWRELFDASHWGNGRNHNSSIAKPTNYDQDPSQLPPHLRHYHDANGSPWCIAPSREEDGQGMRRYLAAYYALVAEMDHHIGSIINCLKQNNALDNTIIIYTTDHGDFVGEHGLAEKAAWAHNVYEATLRVPLIMRCPHMKKRGVVSNDLVELVDIMPSIFELCNIMPKPAKHPALEPAGQSLAPHIVNGTAVQRQHVISENHLQRTIISQSHKLSLPTEQADNYPIMLFERDSDPHELINRAEDPSLEPVAATMRDALESFDQRIPALATFMS